MSASVVEHKTLIIGSTVNPGDCELFQQALEDQKVHVVYCPTFIAQGSVLRDIRQPHSLLIGTQDQLQFDRCKAIFERLVSADTPIFQMHTTAAEISKIAANCRSTMEIVYFNLIGRILVNSGLDEEIGEVNDFLNLSKKSVRWRSGFGYGGPCYPRDNRAFVQYTKKLDYEYELGSFIDQSNQQQVQFLFDYFVTLNKKKLPFFFDHISYKPNVAIFEESQPLQLAEKLLSYGYPVYIKQSEFLTRDIEISLSKKWGDQLTFISPEQLESNHVALFHIEFESLWRKTANNEIIEENVRPEE